MTIFIQRETEHLKKKLISLASVVESSVQMSIRSLKEFDTKLATKVISMDEKINRMEVELEEECLKVLALHQPVAHDLRFIVAVMKINNDLERIGDLAGNIAERAIALGKLSYYEAPFNVTDMADKAHRMLKEALDALLKRDTDLAKDVIELDDEIDSMHSENYKLIKDGICRNVENIDELTNYLTVSRHLERIADLATNIAEDVYYMIEGEIIRHTGPS